MKEKEQLLSIYCSRKNSEADVDTLLRQNPGIDLTNRDGIYFKLAIKNNNLALLNILLDYYKGTNLQSDRESLEYKIAKHTLSNILEEAQKQWDISDTILEALKPYITSEEDSDHEQDLGSFEIGSSEDVLSMGDNADIPDEL